MSRTGLQSRTSRYGQRYMIPRGRPSQTAWLLSWLAWSVLFMQQIADAWIHQVPEIIWFGKLFPLLLFLPGMARDRLRSYIWLCFVSLGYFIALVERIFAQPDSALAMLGLASVVVLFCVAMFYVRWRAREWRAATESEEIAE